MPSADASSQPSLTGLDLHASATTSAEADAQQAFADVADAVRATLAPQHDPWEHSPYRWVKELPPRSRGRAAALIIHRWLAAHGHLPAHPSTAGHDLTAAGTDIAVKLSTRWDNGTYVFQGLRATGYETLALLGLSPDRAHLWFLPRALALQHAAATGGQGAWLTLDADQPPSWAAQYGGDPQDAITALTAELPRPGGPTLHP